MKDKPFHHPVTLKDIARAAGLSHGAVSLALRNSSEVSGATRERVQAKAREMGYEPNPMAARLASYKKNSSIPPIHATMGWLNFWPDPKKLRSYAEFDRYWQGASTSAAKHGYRLEEFICNTPDSFQQLEKTLQAKGITGILIPPGELPDYMEQFSWKQFSAVRLGTLTRQLGRHSITAGQVSNTMLAFEKVREKGYRRIGFVGIDWRPWKFAAGYLWAQMNVPVEERLPPCLFGVDQSNRDSAFQAWLKDARPDAIITERTELMTLLKSAGYRVPEDIGVAALSTLDCPIDAGIDQNPAEIGRVSVLMLLSLINDNDHGLPVIPRQIEVTGHWVDGSSLPGRA